MVFPAAWWIIATSSPSGLHSQQSKRTMITTAELDAGEYAAFYANYVRQVPAGFNATTALRDSRNQLLDLLERMPADKYDYAYAPGKWTVRQSLQHIIDTERIFSTRLLRLGRGDATPQAGFEQDDYARAAGDCTEREWEDMVEEFRLLRNATLLLVNSIAPASAPNERRRVGTVSGSTMSYRALCFITAGHVYHHVSLYRERYLGGSN